MIRKIVNTLFFVGLMLFVTDAMAQTGSYYYYYKNRQIIVSLDSTALGLLTNDTSIVNYLGLNAEEKAKIAFSTVKNSSNNYYYSKVVFPNNSTLHNKENLLNVQRGNSKIKTLPCFKTKRGIKVGLTNRFYVQIGSHNDTISLFEYARRNGIIVVGNVPYMDDWYVLSCPIDSSFNALEIANKFYESGLFSATEPEFVYQNLLATTDEYYNDQWGLHNVGQYGGIQGIDINADSAWTITKGSGVKVAVFDQGFELNHPDLAQNVYNQGYDAETGTVPSQVRGEHGTACAGIIGARINNIGIAGVAPESSITSISIDLSWFNTPVQIASGFNWARVNGVDVISNSWGGYDTSSIIEIAIKRAIDEGRAGKGCVVVFASGNENDTNIRYPGCFSPEILVVGAVSPCGERKSPNSCDGEFTWGSCFGKRLDVVAPGVLIPTTDMENNNGYNPLVPIHPYCGGNMLSSDYTNTAYTVWFNGTSSACPHVAGVAALVLSVNPNLTGRQVCEIIESTAKKIRTDKYTYTQVPHHNSGSWNDSVGYGMINAYAAVRKAQNIDLYIRDTLADGGTMPCNVARTWESPDIWVEDLNGNRVENPAGNSNYYVCVEIHNRSNYPSSGNEKLFLNWAKAGVNDYWSENWTSINLLQCQQPKGGIIGDPDGVSIPVIPAHSSKVVKVPWHTPSSEFYLSCTGFNENIWHFCLLARVHDCDEIAHENEQYAGVYWLVKNHNNVAQRNVTLGKSLVYTSVFSVNNPTANARNYLIRLLKRQNNFAEKITDFAEISLSLDDDLLQNINYDMLTGAKFVNDNTLLITDEDFTLPITLTSGQYNTMETSVNFFTNKTPQNDTTYFDIIAYTDEDLSEIAGGQSYHNIYTTGRTFHANAGNDTAVLLNTTATLHATQINENATYRWYDKQRNFLYEGVNYSATPTQTSEYILEVTAESDGYRDLDTVKVTVVPGCIRSITPNPVSDNWVTVSYEYATTVTTAQLLIYNTATTTLVGNYDLSNLGNVSSLDIEVTNYPAGSYTVVLVCDNAVCHSKVLIRQ